MHRKQLHASYLLAVAFTSACIPQCCPAQPIFGETFTGDGTSYNNQHGGGYCSYQISGSTSLPWHDGARYWVATGQYNASRICGLCAAFHGTQESGSPIPTSVQYAQIADDCPECAVGSLDFQNSYDSRDPISWQPVQCAVGDSPLHYSFQGSNPWYLKLQVSNGRVPVESVSIQAHGLGSAFVPAVRSADNYFLRTGDGPYQLPLTITVTSILGDTVEDVVHAGDPSTEALIRGAVQFPEHTDLGVVTEAPARASGPSPKPTTPSPSPVPKPHPKPSSKRKPTPRPAGPCKRPLQPYAQCGGLGGSCVGADCVAGQIKGTCCLSGYGSDFFCREGNTYYYQCVPAVLTESSGPPEADSGTSNGTAIPPFASCGIAGSCQRTAAVQLAAREPAADSPPPPPEQPHPPSAMRAWPTPPPPAQAPPLVYAALSSRGEPLVTIPSTPSGWCHQEPLPGADCATAYGDEFSCVAAPQSGPHTGAVEYRYTCIPTASMQPVA